jgi:Tfp pilus assembly protein PilV
LAYQPPANSTFLSEQATVTSNQPAVLFSQNKSAPATSQTNMLLVPQFCHTQSTICIALALVFEHL